MIVAGKSSMRTLSNGLRFSSALHGQRQLRLHSATVSMISMLILYIFGQKYFVTGQEASGIKG